MERYLSIGVSTIVALMAAHRAATSPYSQEQIARIDAYLREDKRPTPPTARQVREDIVKYRTTGGSAGRQTGLSGADRAAEHGHQRQNGHAELDEAFSRRMVRARVCGMMALWHRAISLTFCARPEGAAPMNDTIHEIFQDGDAYKVRIARLGEFTQEADGFSSYADAASWIAQAQRLGAVRAEQQKPISSPYMRVV
jgi:hypothetical protein